MTITITDKLSIALTGNNATYQSFRVVACSYTSCVNTGIALTRKPVVFIYTDLLGSPVAETEY